MKKKMCSMLLAVGMTLALSVPAMADEGTTSTASIEVPATPNIKATTGGMANTTTTLTGTIQPTTLAVTIPTRIAFDVDPTLDVSGAIPEGKTAVTLQVTRPETIQIVNNSVVPVYTKIKSVAVENATLVQYADSLSETDLKGAKTVMFGYKAKGAITDFNNPKDWLKAGEQAETYALGADDGKIAARTLGSGGGSATPGTMDMEIYLQTTNGWAAGNTFTVTPTIVVSVKDFQTPMGDA